MASAREPLHPLEKRDLLHADPPNAERVNAIASGMAASERFPEAIDYVEITKDPGLLSKAEADAVRRGSVWLLQQVERIRGAKCPAETWGRLADAAAAAGRHFDAVRGLQLAGREADAEAHRLANCPDYDPFKPLGK